MQASRSMHAWLRASLAVHALRPAMHAHHTPCAAHALLGRSMGGGAQARPFPEHDGDGPVAGPVRCRA